jgi:hypothetical protein
MKNYVQIMVFIGCMCGSEIYGSSDGSSSGMYFLQQAWEAANTLLEYIGASASSEDDGEDESDAGADHGGGAAGGGGAIVVRLYDSYQQARGLWPDEFITLRDCSGLACVEKLTTWEAIRASADGTNCGYHALKNAYCVLMYHKTHDEVWLTNMQTSGFLLTVLKPWLEYTVPYRSVGDQRQYRARPLGNWPSTDELNRLIGIIENPATENRVQEKLTQLVYRNLQRQALTYGNTLMEQRLVPSEYITVVDKLALFGADVSADQMITENAVQTLSAIQERFRVQEDAIHTFIVNTTVADTFAEAGYHWVMIVVYKEAGAIKWGFANSLGGMIPSLLEDVRKTFDPRVINVVGVKRRSLLARYSDLLGRVYSRLELVETPTTPQDDKIHGLQFVMQRLYNGISVDCLEVPELNIKLQDIFTSLLGWLKVNPAFDTKIIDVHPTGKGDKHSVRWVAEKIYEKYSQKDRRIGSLFLPYLVVDAAAPASGISGGAAAGGGGAASGGGRALDDFDIFESGLSSAYAGERFNFRTYGRK